MSPIIGPTFLEYVVRMKINKTRQDFSTTQQCQNVVALNVSQPNPTHSHPTELRQLWA